MSDPWRPRADDLVQIEVDDRLVNARVVHVHQDSCDLEVTGQCRKKGERLSASLSSVLPTPPQDIPNPRFNSAKAVWRDDNGHETKQYNRPKPKGRPPHNAEGIEASWDDKRGTWFWPPPEAEEELQPGEETCTLRTFLVSLSCHHLSSDTPAMLRCSSQSAGSYAN